MADCGKTWSDEEVSALIAAWSDESIQRKLSTMVRNEAPFRAISERLAEQDIHHSSKQCQDKMEQLKRKYKDKVDSLRRSGVGVDSDDEADIFVNFKWFHKIHAVMGSRAVVNPPLLLQASDRTSRDGDFEEEDTTNSDPQTATTLSFSTEVAHSVSTSTTTTLATSPTITSQTQSSNTPCTSTPSSATASDDASSTHTVTPVTTTPSTSMAVLSRRPGSSTYQPSRKQKLNKAEQADKHVVRMFKDLMQQQERIYQEAHKEEVKRHA